MALFNFGKKKKEMEIPVCACNGNGNTAKNIEMENNCCVETQSGICCIKVLGSGCKTCHEQYENVKKAITAIGLNIEVEYITDMEKIMTYGVMSMPAIVVNENVVSMGKLLKTADVERLFSNLKSKGEQ